MQRLQSGDREYGQLGLAYRVSRPATQSILNGNASKTLQISPEQGDFSHNHKGFIKDNLSAIA
ncbi:MAG: hypothetical protein HC890_17555 [Chloroflexaceae bacterium]|nr:hypothetical protein [Chloroflexaceae bacterium]